MSILCKFALRMEFVDSHTHIIDEAFEGCEEEIISRALSAGVTRMLQADVDSVDRERMYAICESHPGTLYPMLGLYPGSVGENWRDELDALEAYIDRKPVAIGEIGLDFHYGAQTAELQQEVFRLQLEMASRLDLPVNIHLREATEQFFRIIEDCRHLHLRGNLHAFSGSAEMFRRLSRNGDWYVGIGGVLTFKKASIAREVRDIPLERIILETDAPYLTPVPHRGERNESSYIPIIASFLAGIKETSVGEVARITTDNAIKLFNLK